MKAKDTLVMLLAQGMGIGRVPFAPGTLGTLLGLPLVWWLWQADGLTYVGVLAAVILVAVGSASRASAILGKHDDGSIVIDEIAGILLALALVPASFPALIAGFLLFRFFDIAKPPPIGFIDRRGRGGLGIVLDDLAAGFVTNLILQLVFRFI